MEKKRKKESNTFLTLIGILLQLVKHKMDTKSGINDIYSISSTIYLYLHLFIAEVQIPTFPTIEVLKKKKKKPIYRSLYTRNPFTTITHHDNESKN